MRAYLRTVWLWTGTVQFSRLASEMARPVDTAAARRFGMMTALLAGAVPAGLIVWEFVRIGGTGFLDEWVNPLGPNWFMSIASPPQSLDAVVPWLAGATLAPVLPVCATLFMFLLTMAHTLVFRFASSHQHLVQRGIALSYYALAPLAWLPLVLGLFAAIVLTAGYWEDGPLTTGAPSQLLRVLLLALLMVLGLVPLLTWINLLRLVLRLTQNDWLRTLVAAGAIPAAWCLCAVVAFGIVPWVVGFLWLLVDSLL